jgi:hypothetical protein
MRKKWQLTKAETSNLLISFDLVCLNPINNPHLLKHDDYEKQQGPYYWSTGLDAIYPHDA